MSPKLKEQHKRLEELRAENDGVITPAMVVEDAKSENSPFHSEFEWDIQKAAYDHWLDTARSIIRKITVEIRTSTKVIAAPFYVKDPRVAPDDQGYTAVAEIKDEEEVARAALLYEFKRAIGVLERACNIADALGMTEQVNELLLRVRSLHENLAA